MGFIDQASVSIINIVASHTCTFLTGAAGKLNSSLLPCSVRFSRQNIACQFKPMPNAA